MLVFFGRPNGFAGGAAEQATDDAVRGETIALVVLTLVLIAFLGGLVAGLLPLAAALVMAALVLDSLQ